MKFDHGQGYPVAYNADTSILLNGANPQLEGKITGAKDFQRRYDRRRPD